MSEIAIELKNVHKRFKGNDYDSVSDVSLKIEKGDFVTILGTSGSGKTTLLKMVNRIYELTSGEILYFGEDITRLPVNDYRRQIGYVIQQGGLFPHKTVEENIAVIPRLLKWDKEKTGRRIKELMGLVRLEYDTYRNRYPRSLSGGEQQRVGIARALAADPSVMLMDEPFGAIDAITRGVLQQEVKNLQHKLGNTILFVTHDVFEAFLLGQKIIVMDRGRVQQFDTPYNIMLHPANEFVKRLITTGDVYDKLRVLSVESHLEEASEEEIQKGVRIDSSKYLNDALTMFVKEECSYLIVAEGNRVKGKLPIEYLKQMMKE
ncbi:MAG: ABC transporter ATP-binding protein [Dorea sp.]|nr:ABC transporter ATP-binding protein [Dorea sp.]